MFKIDHIEQFDSTINGCTIIAGPCSAESEEQIIECARELKQMGVKVLRAGAWKPRTRCGNFEGYGEEALKWLCSAKRETGMYITTEVANTRHVEAAMRAGIDMVWIGARTTTSPFAVQEIADALRGTNLPVMVKNPINTELELWIGAFERLSQAGITRLAAIHRGFSVQDERIYRYSPQWQIPIELSQRIPGLPVLCDPSHMGGRKDLILPLSQMALNMKASGLFIEVHPHPEQALSDADQQLTPALFKELLSQLQVRQETSAQDLAALKPYRESIGKIDAELIELLAERLRIARATGQLKTLRNLTILQPERYKSLAQNMVNQGKLLGLDEQFVRSIFEVIHAESLKQQL